jgi:hypothetical protein
LQQARRTFNAIQLRNATTRGHHSFQRKALMNMSNSSFFKSQRSLRYLSSLTLLVILYALAPVAQSSTRAQKTLQKKANKAAPAPLKTEMLQPDPKFSPEQVIKIVLEALQHNDQPAPDSGIAIAFRFASPGNRAATGPLNRFIQLVKNPSYRPMLNHKSAERGPIRISDDVARQRVTLTTASDEKVVYLFTLSKQTDDQYKNCWMTDGVERVLNDQESDQQVAKSNGRAASTRQW